MVDSIIVQIKINNIHKMLYICLADAGIGHNTGIGHTSNSLTAITTTIAITIAITMAIPTTAIAFEH